MRQLLASCEEASVLRVLFVLTFVSLQSTLASSLTASDVPEVVTLAAERVVIIEAPEGAGARILIAIPGLEDLSGRTIISARLLLPDFPVSEAVILEVRPIRRAWSPETVSWTNPWTLPGGDYGEVVGETCRVAPDRDSARPVRFNVGTTIRSCAEGVGSNYGFIIKTSEQVVGDGPVRELPSSAVSSLSSGTINLVALCASDR